MSEQQTGTAAGTVDGAVATGTTFRLMYRSHSLLPPEDRKALLGALFSEARSANKRRGVCGALLISDDSFVQVLEGPEGVVRPLFEHIATDARHDDVALLDAGTVAGPVFERWAMAEVSPSGGADVPLIAHVDGISPASARRTTAAQEAVLDVMREAARPAPGSRGS